MTKLKSYLVLILLIACVIGAGAIDYNITHQAKNTDAAGAGTTTYFTAVNTVNTAVTCSATPTLFLTAGSGRNYAAWTVNSSTNVTFFFSATSTGLTYGGGLVINGGGGSYELKAENLYVGNIYCEGNGASSTVGLIYNQ